MGRMPVDFQPRFRPPLRPESLLGAPACFVPTAARGLPEAGAEASGKGKMPGMGENATGGDRRDRQRLTVPEAATVLGVTVDAVRGRIRRGTLPSEHDEHGKVYVWIDAPEADRPGPSETGERPSGASQGPSAGREELVESLLEQVAYMREQLAEEREARRRADTIMAQLSQANAEQARTIRALEAPRDEPQPPETAAASPEGTETRERREGSQEATERPSWWRRLFGVE